MANVLLRTKIAERIVSCSLTNKNSVMKKPIIGISTGFLVMENSKFAGMKRVYVNKDYTDAVEKAGGIPLLLPPLICEDSVQWYIHVCDGFLFSGGADVNPVFYGEEPLPALEPFDSELDKAHLFLMEKILEADKPLLAICRGHQLLNVVCGGTLYQDMSEIPGQTICHNQPSSRGDRIHHVKIAGDSILYKLFGETLFVNSYHHQSIKKAGRELRVVASSSDGVVEAVQMEKATFVVGVQWHPEMLLTDSDDMLPLFKELINSTQGDALK